MANFDKAKSGSKLSRHVLTLQKAQRELENSKAEERDRHAKYSEWIKQNERNVAALASRAKQLEREKFKERESKFATPLGLMLLEALRSKGLQGILLSAQDIESKWSTEKCLDLLDFLKSSPTDFLDAINAEVENSLTQPGGNESEISVPPRAFDSSAF